ncbi:MAG TPA: branched-chain amino acid transaminase [Dehalococcoidia bacterium]|jgi:branched-chain amino acid aminotransferase|nr:branched-chain amino acid transaminase [Dehalococcoidia bacterium]
MPTSYAYFQKRIVPLEEAKLPVMTHAFLYGTGVFEGIRGNWSDERGAILLFRPREHFERIKLSARVMHIDLPASVDELTQNCVEVVARCGFTEDVYIRPIAYKSGEVIGPRLHDVADDYLLFVLPFGNYLDLESGIRCMTSSWRRVPDTSIPARAKVTGLYVNSALAKTEAMQAGFDEAIMLNDDGHVSEGSGENVVILRHGRLITPERSDNVLEGITLASVMELARKELGLEVIERTIDRTELYVADECFMTGTAAHLSPVIEVDNRKVGDGGIGPVTRKLQALFFDAIRGRNPAYAGWVVPVPITGEEASAPAAARLNA